MSPRLFREVVWNYLFVVSESMNDKAEMRGSVEVELKRVECKSMPQARLVYFLSSSGIDATFLSQLPIIFLVQSTWRVWLSQQLPFIASPR